MILKNGYIAVAQQAGGGTDENGDPIKVEERWGKPILCNWKQNNYRGHAEGEAGVFSSASYTILIEGTEGFEPCRIKLCDDSGNELGIFDVPLRGINVLKWVGNTQIVVP